MTQDRTLDWTPRFDPRSLDHRVRTVAPSLKERNRIWKRNTWLDQGQEGACTGFSAAHAVATTPRRYDPVTRDDAEHFYHLAQQNDEWPGENYEGSSVLGAMQGLKGIGIVSRYLWATTLDEIIHAVGYIAPVVMGINWYEGMFDPDADWMLHKTGKIAGGHAILIGGVNLQRSAFLLYNSWGKGWGLDGNAWLSFADLNGLIREQGEFAVPTKVKAHPIPAA